MLSFGKLKSSLKTKELSTILSTKKQKPRITGLYDVFSGERGI